MTPRREFFSPLLRQGALLGNPVFTKKFKYLLLSCSPDIFATSVENPEASGYRGDIKGQIHIKEDLFKHVVICTFQYRALPIEFDILYRSCTHYKPRSSFVLDRWTIAHITYLCTNSCKPSGNTFSEHTCLVKELAILIFY